MADKPPDPDYRLLLRPLKSEVPIRSRLNRLLKFALRACGLRCVEIEEVIERPVDGEDLLTEIDRTAPEGGN